MITRCIQYTLNPHRLNDFERYTVSMIELGAVGVNLEDGLPSDADRLIEPDVHAEPPGAQQQTPIRPRRHGPRPPPRLEPVRAA
jgi:hypothetical protein